MKGGNLIHSKQIFLFNTLDTKDFGAYEDSVTSRWHLLLKEFGVDLMGGTTGDSALPEDVYARSQFRESRNVYGDLSFLSFEEGLDEIEDMLVYDVGLQQNIKIRELRSK